MAFYRKLDNLGQLQTVSGMRALQDSAFQVTDDNAKDIGIIVGTSEGGLGATYDFEELIAEAGNAGGSAFKFPHTVYNAAGGYLSICSGIKGYGVTITTGPLSGLDSIGYSMNVIHDGQEKAMMATGTDENLPIITEFAQKLGVAAGDVVAPFAENEGFVVGDGSVSIMLEEEDYAKARGAKVYCYALGFGHGRKNVKFGKLVGSDEALDKAINDALADAGISAPISMRFADSRTAASVLTISRRAPSSACSATSSLRCRCSRSRSVSVKAVRGLPRSPLQKPPCF